MMNVSNFYYKIAFVESMFVLKETIMNTALIKYIDSLTEEQIDKIILHLEELTALCELHNQPYCQEQTPKTP